MTKTQTAKPRDRRLELAFLGAPEVCMGARVLRFRSRKTVALVAYLALEPGLHSRDKLADLLWPQSVDGTGRASLRTALAQINNEIGPQFEVLRSSREAVGWNLHDLESDVRDLERAFRAASQIDVPPDLEAQLENAANLWRGDLLEGVTLADAPSFDDWLIARREIARGWLDGVLERLCGLYAESGRVNLALEVAQRRVRLEPLNESAHRSLIELHMRSGNRTAALEAYRACKAILETELGIEPSAQTSELVAALEQPSVRSLERTAMPAALDRPVRLVGREREWAQMEAAWNAGQAIVLHGAPGVGKTRLMLEFAASKGSYLHCVGRPGDDLVPYGTHARTFKQVTDTFAPEDIPDWIRHELSRIIPSLGGSPSPISSEADKLRFFEAKAEILRLFFERGCAVLAYDDVQFVDPASVEAGWYTLAKFLPSQPGQPRSIHAYRTDEIPDQMKSMLRQALDAGIVVIIEVAPLEVEAVGELLEDLELGFPAEESLRLSDSMYRFTGGNPLFVLETVRALTGRGGLESLTAERFENRRRVSGLPRTPKVQAIIQRRLERLSTPAQDLARVAAVAGEYFTLELGAKVLETPILELSRFAMELEVAHVWRGLRFSHDLLFETTLENIPESLSPLLHGRVLDALEGSGVAAAVLAHHAIAAGRTEQIVRYSLQAGQEAYDLDVIFEVVTHLERVRSIINNPSLGFDPRSVVSDPERVQMYRTLQAGYGPNGLRRPLLLRRALEEMFAFESEVQDAILKRKIHFWHARDQFDRTGDEGLLRALLEARLEEAGRDQDDLNELEMHKEIGKCEFYMGHFVASRSAYARALTVARRLQDENQIGLFLHEIAALNYVLGNWVDAEAGFVEVVGHINSSDRFNTTFNITRLRWQRAHNWLVLGRARDAVDVWRDCLESWRGHEDPLRGLMTRSWLSLGLLDLGEYGEALELANDTDRRRSEFPECSPWDLIPAAVVHLQLGQLGVVRAFLEEVRALIQGGAAIPWPRMLALEIEGLFCILNALDGDWNRAYQHALVAFEVRGALGSEGFGNIFMKPCWPETEALLRGGRDDLARESVNRIGQSVGPYQRLRITHMRSIAVLEVFDGKLESAIGHLLEARALMIPIGLPNERWTLEAKIAELYEQNGDLKKAREAHNCALKIVNTLADGIPDEASRTVFLEFARMQVSRVERISA